MAVDVPTVLAACDAEYQQGLRPNLIAHQQAFGPNNGRFWQGLTTHSVIPADGVKSTPDVGFNKPSDEQEGWPASIRNLATLQAVSSHKYVAPGGQGFLIERKVMINGELYVAVEDVGGHLGSHGWQVVPPMPTGAP